MRALVALYMVTGVLGIAQGQEAEVFERAKGHIFSEQQTTDGLTELIGDGFNDSEWRGFCGLSSLFWGKHSQTQVVGRVLMDLSPESLCETDLTGYVVVWPNILWHNFDDDPDLLASYPCVDYKNSETNFLDFFVKTNVTGLIFAMDWPNHPSGLGLLWTDDFGYDREKYRADDVDLVVFECAFPKAWESIFMELGTTQGEGLYAKFVMEALPFTEMLQSPYYHFLFRIVLGSWYSVMAIYGFRNLRLHFQLKKRRGVQIIVTILNAITSLIISVMLVVEGWWATGSISSLVRDSFSPLLPGLGLGSCMLLTVQWLEFRTAVANGKITEGTLKDLLWHRKYLVIPGSIVVLIDIAFVILCATRTIVMAEVIEPLVSLYVLLEISFGFFYLKEGHIFSKNISENAKHFGGPFREIMMKISYDVKFSGVSLVILVISTILIGLPNLTLDCNYFWVSSMFFIIARGMFVWSMLKLSGPKALRKKSTHATSTSQSHSRLRVIPATLHDTSNASVPGHGMPSTQPLGQGESSNILS